MVGITGSGYCTAATRASALLLSNAVQVATVHVLTGLVAWLAKLTIAAACAVAALVLFDLSYFTDAARFPDTAVSSPLVPVVLTAVLAYIVADTCFQVWSAPHSRSFQTGGIPIPMPRHHQVWETAVDTMLLSHCNDCESNGGVPKAPTSPELAAALGGGKEKGTVVHVQAAAGSQFITR